MKTAFTNAMRQLNEASQTMNLSKEVRERLSAPEKMHIVTFPLVRDDGTQEMITGYRSQYSSVLGHYKGGIRFSPNVNEEEVRTLSFWMTIKAAVLGLPLGGGKGGVTVDTRNLSDEEIESVARGWVRALSDVIGPHKDVPAPDVATNPQIMGWMVDEYSKIVGHRELASFTGKAVRDGGIAARATSTARGGFYILEDIVRERALTPAKIRIAIQGFGNAGSVFAELSDEAGFLVVGISDSRHSIISPSGLNVSDVLAYKKEHGNLMEFTGKNVDIKEGSQEVLYVECDVLVPAAVENQITQENASEVNAGIIIELANGPVTPEADYILHKNKVVVVPDVLANAGGVVVSHFEWEQNIAGKVWSEDLINEKLQTMMLAAYGDICRVQSKYSTSLRTASFITALNRISDKLESR